MTKASVIAVLFAATVVLPFGAVYAQPPGRGGGGPAIVDNPCPPPLQRPAQMEALQKQGGRAVFESTDPVVVAFREEENRRRAQDRHGRCRYLAANAEFAASGAPPPVVVFTGDSITDFWPNLDREFFTKNNYMGRGIGAQVSTQGLARFRQDVIELKPKVVHILYGTNDIAGLGGPTTFENIQNNLMAMVQMARANNIKVVLGTVLPISNLPGGQRVPELTPNIRQMNEWIRAYGRRENIPVADYYAVLSDPAGNFKSELNSDGVHPNLAGYRVMEPVTRAAVQAALTRNSTRR
jgi:lysophospholipase L1-like esterase